MTDKQFLDVMGVLIQIRDALQPDPRPPQTDACDHPEADRVDLRGLSDREHWICRLCHYEHHVTVQMESY